MVRGGYVRALLFLAVAVFLLLAAKCGEEKGGASIFLLPSGHFTLRSGETIQTIDESVEARYARVFNTAYEVVQCPLYRRIVTDAGKEYFLGMVLDTSMYRALTLPVGREAGNIDSLLTDSVSYVWYRYVRDSVRATACVYIHEGKVAYIVGSVDLDGSPSFALDSLRSRFVVK